MNIFLFHVVHNILYTIEKHLRPEQVCKQSNKNRNWYLLSASLVFSLLPSAARSNGAAAGQTSSLRSKGLGILGKLKMSAELLIALAALLSWVVVGVVMFDFVEYKAVPGRSQFPENISSGNVNDQIGIDVWPVCLWSFADIQQIMTDPVQAVNDAVDEVSSLLNKFHGT